MKKLKEAKDEATAKKVPPKKSGWGSKKPVEEKKPAVDTVAQAEAELKKLREDYVPIDFGAYTIDDSRSPVLTKAKADELEESQLAKAISKEEKLWRISSLTASVDEETKILILPLPESKRKVKVADTSYDSATYRDLHLAINKAANTLSEQPGTPVEDKRYSDMTDEEI